MPALRDVAVAAALVLLGLVSLPAIDAISATDRPIDAGAALLVLVAAGAPAFRTRFPLGILIVVATASSAYLLRSYPYGPILFGLAVAVWTAARGRMPLASGIAAAAACGGLLLPLPQHPGALGGAIGVLPTLAWVAVPYTAGVARRLVVEARQRERAEADRRLIASERLRLAHEVHDIVGHALAAIQMQADIALHIGDEALANGHERTALTTISRASRDALDELRSTLSTAEPETEGGNRGPGPGLGRLDRLIAGVEAAGTRVDLTVQGRPRALPPRVDLTAYRLVQESLTNVVKHSIHPHADVTVVYRPDTLSLEVANDHVDNRQLDLERAPAGLGTSSMRTRVEQLGGTFHAGHHDDKNRYIVAATLPIDDTEATR